MAVEKPPVAGVVAMKEKKPKAPKEKKPKSAKAPTLSHPPYFQMIKEALLTLKEKSGSSPYAIAKYMEQHHKAVLPANFKKMLGVQLKNSVARGKLIKVKASYKLSESSKKEKVVTKVPKAKKPKQANSASAPKSKSAVKPTKKIVPAKPTKKVVAAKPTTKKVVGAAKSTKKVAEKKVKKSTPAKPRQPKSIKSPAAKKARRQVSWKD